MMRKILAATAALALCACAGSSRDTGAAAACSAIAIAHVTVLPMTDVAELRDQTVIVEDGRITRIDAASRVRALPSRCTIDGEGRFLTPGLADAHVHLFDEGDLALYLRFGVTSVLNMGGSHMHLRLRDAIAAGEVNGPTLYTTSPMLKVDATPLVEFEETPRDAAEAATLVAAYDAAGYDFIKVWGAFSPEMYGAITDAARRGGIRVTGHIPRDVGLAPVLAAGQSIAHVEELINKHFRAAPSDEQIRAAAAELVAANTPVITTLVTYEAIAASNAADVSPLLSREGAEYIDPVRLFMWGPDANRLRQSGRDPQRFQRLLQVMQQITNGLEDGGVQLVAGTDAGELPGLVPGLDLHRELALLVEAGLTPEQALRTATVNFGAFIGGERVGVVEVGARADLLLLDADPRVDIANTRAIAGVMARGRYHDRAALDAMVAALQARNARTGAYVQAVMSGGAEAGAAHAQGAALTPVLFMALGLAQRGDLATAEAVLRQAAAAHPTREEPYFIIAGLRGLQNDEAGARAAVDAALARAPDHERLQRMRRAMN